MVQTIASLKKTARFAGWLYLLLALTGFYGIIYVPSQIIVKGDVVTTAKNILDKEFLFRTGIACHIISATLFLVMVLVLYKLLRQVNDHQAKLMVAIVVVQVPIVFLLETCRITSLMVLKGEVLKSLPPEQQQDLMMIFLKIHGYGIMTLELFWGLWLIPFGRLVFNSGFIPRVFGVLLMMTGVGYAVDCLTYILFPGYRTFSQPLAFTFSGIGELSIIAWLLIKGVLSNKTGIVENHQTYCLLPFSFSMEFARSSILSFIFLISSW